MDHPAVDDKYDARREMLQQISDECFKIIGTNIVAFNRKIQSQAMAVRRTCQCRNHRQAIPAIPTAQDRRLTFGCPSTAYRRLQHKPAFVQKNAGFTRSASFFLSAASRSVATGRRPLDSARGPCFRASGNSIPSGGECARRWTGRRQSRSVFQLLRRSVEASTTRSGSHACQALSTAVFSACLSACQTDRACARRAVSLKKSLAKRLIGFFPVADGPRTGTDKTGDLLGFVALFQQRNGFSPTLLQLFWGS